MPNLVPVSFDRHGRKQLLPRSSWAFAARQQATALLVAEFPAAAHHLPIVFANVNGTLIPSALLGLRQGFNAFVTFDGRWRGEYVPAILQRHPFALVRKDQDADDFVLCVDEESDRLADSGGEALFTADGKQAPVLEQALKFATDFARHAPAGETLCALLREHELLTPLMLKSRDQEIPVKGVSVVDERKLNALPDDAFLKLRTAGALPAVYAHIFSLRQLQRLAEAGDGTKVKG